MRKLVVVLLTLAFVLGTVEGFAQKQKGASQKAQEKASEQAIFHRVGDWFATVGKSKEEKEKILQERRAEREAKRAAKEAEKKAKEAEKEAKRKTKEAQKGKEQGTKTRTRTKKGWELNTKSKKSK